MEEVGDDLVRGAGVLGAQVLPLGGDPGRAGVEVALPGHVAADRDQHRRAEPELLGAEHRRHDDVFRRLEAAVGAQPDARAQAVLDQRLLRLGQTELPGAAGVLDRGQRRGAGAAGVAADQDVVGARLGDAGGDGPDPGLGDQLDADPGARVDLAQVVDELGQVLDRVDVVVRRRRDQRQTGHGVADAGDEVGHLVAGDLARPRRACSLRDLDLQLLGHREVAGGDPEAAGGDLLDLGVRDVRTASSYQVWSSPPSPELERAPSRFMAIESVRCASGLSEPSDIAVTTKRLTIDSTGSTSSSGTGSPSGLHAHQVAHGKSARVGRRAPGRRGRPRHCPC